MSPAFANVVDPIFAEFIEILEQIHVGRADAPENVRGRLDRQFQQADAAFGDRADWLLAKYAVVALIDETLKAVPWDGSNWWTNNSLEFYYFKTNDAAVQFFLRAKEAAQLPQRNALETFYVCVALGFRGLYHLEEKAFLANQLKLPMEIEDWAGKVATGITLRQGRGRFQELIEPIRGAPPLDGKFQFVAAGLLGLMLTLALIVCYFVLYLA